MLAEGAAPFNGRITEEIELRIEVERTYGYLDEPHRSMGMIGFIRVGNFTTNLGTVRTAGDSLRGRNASRRFDDYMDDISDIATEEGLA